MLADGHMKSAIREYFLGYSRTERTGALVLVIVAIALLAVRSTMSRWVEPAIDRAKEKHLNALWEAHKAEHSHPDETARGWAKADEGPAVPVELSPFDPNTLDSIGFRKLGLTARATKGLMNWRRKGKVFYKPEDLEPLYNLPPETYAAIKPYIRIAAVRGSYESRYPSGFGGWKREPIPAFIDLNTTDAPMLVRLNGIGQTLADKIIAKRMALGGFLKHEQLLEVYKFPDTTYAMLREKLRINPAAVRKLNINAATEAQFAAHPYIGEKTAKNILMLRDGFGTFSSVEQLKQVPLMTAEMFRKIAPYCTVQ